MVKKRRKGLRIDTCDDQEEDCPAGLHSLDLWSDVVDLHAVLVSHHHVVRGPRVCAQDHAILANKQNDHGCKSPNPVRVTEASVALAGSHTLRPDWDLELTELGGGVDPSRVLVLTL